MRKWLLAFTALVAVSCGSAPSSEPAPQAPAQSSPATSASAVASSGPAPSIQFAGRLTFPANSDWEKASGADRPLMTIEFSEGGKRAHGKRPVLMLYTEEFESWASQFEGDVFKAYGPCGVTLPSTHALPVRYTEGDITTAGGRVGQYYRSKSCDPQSESVRHTWIFNYEDANGNQRGVMIHGFPTPGSVSDFPYNEAVEYIRRLTW